MALIETRVEAGQLVLNSFGMEPLTVPHTQADMNRLNTQVWGDDVRGIDLGDTVSSWLSQAIDEDCRLLAFPASEIRQCDPKIAKPGDSTQFADGYPLLIVSQASLDDLNDRLAQPVEMARFRPNIVVSGCDSFAEDQWSEIAINDINIRLVEPCARCSVPTVDPSNGTLSGPEPIHTLSSYRERNGEIFFGVNAIPDQQGMITVGDSITLIT